MSQSITVAPKRLAESISSTAGSFKLNNIQGFDGEDLVSANMPDSLYVTFQDSSGKEVEIMKIDPATIADPSITILTRGLSFYEDGNFSEVSGNKKSWTAATTTVNLGTNPPQLYAQLLNKASSELQAVTSDSTFTGLLKHTGNESAPDSVVNRATLDARISNLNTGSSATVIDTYVAGEDIGANKICKLDVATGTLMLASNTDTTITSTTVLVLNRVTVALGNVASGGVIQNGITTLIGLSIGKKYLGLAGAVIDTGDIYIGDVGSNGVFVLDGAVIKKSLQDALQGSSGTAPSSTNKFVDEAGLTVAPYSTTKTYATNDLVSDNGVIYKALAVSTGVVLSDVTKWKTISRENKVMVGSDNVKAEKLPSQILGNYSSNDGSTKALEIRFKHSGKVKITLETSEAYNDATAYDISLYSLNGIVRVLYNQHASDPWVSKTFSADVVKDTIYGLGFSSIPNADAVQIRNIRVSYDLEDTTYTNEGFEIIN